MCGEGCEGSHTCECPCGHMHVEAREQFGVVSQVSFTLCVCVYAPVSLFPSVCDIFSEICVILHQ